MSNYKKVNIVNKICILKHIDPDGDEAKELLKKTALELLTIKIQLIKNPEGVPEDPEEDRSLAYIIGCR